jgi:thiol-disulfide isomerase/thioredoxin
MTSNEELKVILSKVEWCGHCTDFLPVFNESKNLIKNDKILKNININFEVYDMEQDKGIFETKYKNLVDKVEGYPTVFLAKVKNDKISHTVEIGHAQNPDNFIKLIGDAYADVLKQTGGTTEDDIYKQKYLKYKAKYFKLKKQYGGFPFEQKIHKLIFDIRNFTICKKKQEVGCDNGVYNRLKKAAGQPAWSLCTDDYWLEFSNDIILSQLQYFQQDLTLPTSIKQKNDAYNKEWQDKFNLDSLLVKFKDTFKQNLKKTGFENYWKPIYFFYKDEDFINEMEKNTREYRNTINKELDDAKKRIVYNGENKITNTETVIDEIKEKIINCTYIDIISKVKDDLCLYKVYELQKKMKKDEIAQFIKLLEKLCEK